MNSKRRCLYCLSENVTVNIDVQNFASLIQENKFYIGKPVIFFSFAFIKTGSIDSIKFAVKMTIRNVFDRFRDIMNSDLFNDNDKDYYASVTHKISDEIEFSALNNLCIYLEKYYDKM